MLIKTRTLAVAVTFMMSCSAFAADVFYEQRLQMGKTALASKQYVDAAKELRIAAFGLLDEPKRLTETLALLAVAHANVGKVEDIQRTLERFIDIETRFAAYDGAALDPAHRTQFESVLIRTIPRPTLAGIPSLAALVQPAPAVQTQRQPARPTRRDPVPVPAPVTAAPARTSKQAMDEATQLVGARRFAEAVTLLADAVGRDGGNRELRLMLMQSAALALNWPVAAAQVPLVSPFRDSEPVSMFYAAITLYETGRLTDSRQLLNRALPKLSRSPFVEEYASRINSRSGS